MVSAEENIKKQMGKAFSPYECDVTIDAYNGRMSYRIIDKINQKEITHKKDVPILKLYNEDMLKSYIRELRNFLEEEKGCNFNPWP